MKAFNKYLLSARRIVLLALMALPLGLSAQVGEHRADFSIGINGGYALSSVGFQPNVPQGMLGGMTFGVTARYVAEKYFKSICAIVGEVNVMQSGWKEDILTVDNQPVMKVVGDGTEPLAYSRKLTYIQIPVLARMGWGKERKGFQFFIQAGPQIGFLLKESTETNITDDDILVNERVSKVVAQETMPVEKKFDYGVVFGGGVELSHPKVGHFLLEARYYYGLGNIYGSSKRDYFSKSNNGNFVIKLAYLFDLHKTKNDQIK